MSQSNSYVQEKLCTSRDLVKRFASYKTDWIPKTSTPLIPASTIPPEKEAAPVNKHE